MTREFVLMPAFETEWKSMELTDDDIFILQDILLENPLIGKVIVGTGGLRKMRFALEGRGKRSGARVLYIDFAVYEKIFLIYAYPKSEKDNISKAERNQFHQLINQIAKNLGRKN